MAKFIPWFLLPEQKEHRAAVSNDLIKTTTNEPEFLKKVIILKGTEASLSYAQRFLNLVSSLINVSIFHSTWLDTFWTEKRSNLNVQNWRLTVHLYIRMYETIKNIESLTLKNV